MCAYEYSSQEEITVYLDFPDKVNCRCSTGRQRWTGQVRHWTCGVPENKRSIWHPRYTVGKDWINQNTIIYLLSLRHTITFCNSSCIQFTVIISTETDSWFKEYIFTDFIELMTNAYSQEDRRFIGVLSIATQEIVSYVSITHIFSSLQFLVMDDLQLSPSFKDNHQSFKNHMSEPLQLTDLTQRSTHEYHTISRHYNTSITCSPDVRCVVWGNEIKPKMLSTIKQPRLEIIITQN